MITRSDLIRLLRRGFDPCNRNRKIVIVVIVICVIFYLIWPFHSHKGPNTLSSARSAFCKEAALRPYLPEKRDFDVAVYDCADEDCVKQQFLPFVGNGYFGLSPARFHDHKADEHRFRFRDGETLRSSIEDFDPVIQLLLAEHSESSDAFVTNFSSGVVTHIRSYAFTGQCVTISSQIYVHRKYPFLLVQHVTVKNPTLSSLKVLVKRKDPDWKDVAPEKIPDSGGTLYQVLTTKVPAVLSEGKIYVASAALPSLELKSDDVPAASEKTFNFVTGFDTSAPAMPELYENHKSLVQKQLIQAVALGLSISSTNLLKEHVNAWDKIHSSGFSLSFSKAPGILNADNLNATMYYVLSNIPAPLHEHGMVPSTIHQALTALLDPGQCFSAPSTLLYPSKLWPSYSSVEDVVRIADVWLLTLEKRGCSSITAAGADGIAQAMVLSMGGFRYLREHIEFDTHPKDLHRSYTFRGIMVNNVTRLNVYVDVDSTNKVIMFAALTGNELFEEHAGIDLPSSDRNMSLPASGRTTSAAHISRPSPVYACDAGCLDNPISLSAKKKSIPVKLTDPVTPILYVATRLKHIRDLKHSIHVKEVNIAPAHEHHVIALHKHGHRFGGLPLVFWLALAFLVVIFHLFLVKLIYNEYCASETKPFFTPRGRYAV